VAAVLALGAVTFLGSLAFSHSGTRTASQQTTTDPAMDPYGGPTGSPTAQPPANAPDPGMASNSPTPPTPPPSPGRTMGRPKGGGTQTGNAAAESMVLQIVNAERAKVGCRPLAMDTRLTNAARGHSTDMANRGYFDHTTPNGVDFATRITNAGYRWSSAGENIAKGQRTPADVMFAWMHSPGHRANILNCGYVNIGVGLAYDAHHTPVWTQDFASPLH